MGSTTPPPFPVPKIDFSGLNSAASPRGDRWCAVRAQVMQALNSHACFEAVYDKITPDLLQAVFGTSAKELFGLPLETKTRNVSDKLYQGYIDLLPAMACKSFNIVDPEQLHGAQMFTTLMWPQGNPTFCESVHEFGKILSEIEPMVRLMILEGLAMDSPCERITNGLRIWEYTAPGTVEAKTTLYEHKDPTVITLVSQYQIPGLEIFINGEWMGVPLSTNSVTVLVGEIFEGWTNGRLGATNHRVTFGGHVKRYSSIFASCPKDDGHMVHASNEIDDEQG